MTQEKESKVKPLSEKAVRSIRETGYLNVWEGAVRSAKTVASSLAWIRYLSETKERYFIMSGKTLSTLYRNVIGGEFGLTALLGDGCRYRVDREGNRIFEMISIGGETKVCYCFGANDERAFTRLRGLTAGGWYADEINLQPRSFIEEAFRRTIVSSDRRNFWTLNPDNPYHFIYKDFIDKYEEEELPGFHLWHFTLEDNLAIPPERKEELKKQYSGVFYRRYILGERCVAEGIIYDMFSDANLYDDADRPYMLYKQGQRTIAVDYGTTNPCVFLSIWDDGETIWVDDEYRWDSRKAQTGAEDKWQKTDAEYAEAMAEFMGSDPDMQCLVVVDPSAASFKVELKNRGFYVRDADNDVLNGIRTVSTLLGRGALRFHRDKCKETVREMRSYAWDEKAGRSGDERPIKMEDHGCLTGDTLVLTTKGYVPIKSLVGKSGDLITIDPETGKTVEDHFYICGMTKQDAEIYEVEAEDGTKVRCTGDHPFLTVRGWVAAKDLKEDDELVRVDSAIF